MTLRILKVLVQPVLVRDDGGDLEEVVTETKTLTLSAFKEFADNGLETALVALNEEEGTT